MTKQKKSHLNQSCLNLKHFQPTISMLLKRSNVWSVLIILVYLSSLPVAHLSGAPRRRLVVTGDSARIQDETTVNYAWFFNVLGV